MSAELIRSLFSDAWSVLLIIVFFGGTIFVHELGHFLAARRRGLKVERFSIGFGPKIFSWTRGGVEYRLSWLPLGGYVSLPQLVDLGQIEGGSAEEAEPLPPISYTSKVITLVSGAVGNIAFALVLASLLWAFGLPTYDLMRTTRVGWVAETLSADGATAGERPPSPARLAGLQPGDVIERVDGSAVADWMELRQMIAAGSGRGEDGQPRAVLTLRRGDSVLEITVHPVLAGEDRLREIGIAPAETLRVGGLLPGKPAQAAGLRVGDLISAVDGVPVYSLPQLQAHLLRHRDREVAFAVQRGEHALTLPIRPELARDAAGREVARVGFSLARTLSVIHPDPLSQIWDQVALTLRTLRALLSPSSDIGAQHLSGPPGIARAFFESAQSDFRHVLWFAVLLNVNLAVFNLLPIPVLDGGHILFATVARLRRRELPARWIQGIQGVFIALLLSLMAYTSYNDIWRWVRDSREIEAPAAAPAPASRP